MVVIQAASCRGMGVGWGHILSFLAEAALLLQRWEGEGEGACMLRSLLGLSSATAC